MLLMLTGITGTIFFGAIRLITTIAGANGYWAIIGGGITSWIAIYLSTALGRRFPNQTPFEYAQDIFGKWLGKLFGLVIIGFSMLSAALILRSLGDFLITAILPATPLSANIAFMLILVCIGAYIGLEALARFNEGFYPFIFVTWLIVFAATLPKMDFGWFLPLLNVELGRVVTATVLSGTLLIDGLIVLIFYPFVADKEVVLKYTTWSVALGTTVVVLLQGAVVAVFSPNLASSLTFPLLQLAQDASLGVFLERIEAVYLAIWVVGTFIRVAVAFYAASLGLAQTLGLKNHRYFILVLALPVFYLSFQAGNVPTSFNQDGIFNQYGIIVQLGLVLSLLFGAILRKKRGQKHGR